MRLADALKQAEAIKQRRPVVEAESSDPSTEEIPNQDLDGWLAGKRDIGMYGTYDRYKRHPDSIARLGLSQAHLTPLVRHGIQSVSLAADLVALPLAERPKVRRFGEKGWRVLEEALDRPLLPIPVPREER